MDPLIAAFITAWLVMRLWETAKAEWRHTCGQYARTLGKDHPDWSPARVRRNARHAARSWWWTEIRDGLPTFAASWEKNKLLARTQREEMLAAGEKGLRALRDRLDAARRAREASGEAAKPPEPPPPDGAPGRPALAPIDGGRAPRRTGTAPGSPEPGTPEPGTGGGTMAPEPPQAPGEGLVPEFPGTPTPVAVTGTPAAGEGAPMGGEPWKISKVGRMEMRDGVLHVSGFQFEHPDQAPADVAGILPDRGQTTKTGARDVFHGHTAAELHDLSHGPGCQCPVRAVTGGSPPPAGTQQAPGGSPGPPGGGGYAMWGRWNQESGSGTPGTVPARSKPAPGSNPAAEIDGGQVTTAADLETGDSAYHAMLSFLNQSRKEASQAASTNCDAVDAAASATGLSRPPAVAAALAAVKDAEQARETAYANAAQAFAAAHEQGDDYHKDGQGANREAFTGR